MQQQESTTVSERDPAIFFKLPIYPDRLSEIYQFRKRGDPRSLAQLVDEGLELALQGKRPEDFHLSRLREIDLFCALAAHAPEAFSGTWFFIWKQVGGDERYWVFPSYTQDDDLDVLNYEPFLYKEALDDDWDKLLREAERRANVRERL